MLKFGKLVGNEHRHVRLWRAFSRTQCSADPGIAAADHDDVVHGPSAISVRRHDHESSLSGVAPPGLSRKMADFNSITSLSSQRIKRKPWLGPARKQVAWEAHAR